MAKQKSYFRGVNAGDDEVAKNIRVREELLPDYRSDLSQYADDVGTDPEGIDRAKNKYGLSPKLLDYLTSLEENASRSEDSRPHIDRQPEERMHLVGALADASSKAGTLNGKFSDSRPVHKYADLLRKGQELRTDRFSKGFDKQSEMHAERIKNALKMLEMQSKSHEGDLNRQKDLDVAGKKSTSGLDSQGNADRNFAFKMNTKLAEMGKVLNEGRATNGTPYGRMANVKESAGQVLAIKSKADNGFLNPSLVGELEIATAKLMGGSAAAHATIEKIATQTLKMDLARAWEYVLNNPQDPEAGAFVKQLFGVAERERQYSDEAIKEFKSRVLPAYEFLGQHPATKAQWKKLTEQAFDPEAKFNESGVYQRKPYVEPEPEPTAPGDPNKTTIQTPEGMPNVEYVKDPVTGKWKKQPVGGGK